MRKAGSDVPSDEGLPYEKEQLAGFCAPYARAMEVLGRRWMGLTLRVLLTGPHRFNELLAAIPGISDPQLTQRLRELEMAGLVERRVLPTSPVRVEYELTEAGRDLEQVVRVVSAWAHKWLSGAQAPHGQDAEAPLAAPRGAGDHSR
jgi:DNA-binding HxlR family transcriptional regulator